MTAVTQARHPAGTYPVRQRPPLTCMLAGPKCAGTPRLFPGGVFCDGYHDPASTRKRLEGAR